MPDHNGEARHESVSDDDLVAEKMDYTPIRPWPTEVTDEMVEKAARAYDVADNPHGFDPPWERLPETFKRLKRDKMRAALEAVLLEQNTVDLQAKHDKM